jgi:hypothetical protein
VQEEWDPPPLAGQPMSELELIDEMAILALPNDSRIVTIEEARSELDDASRILFTLQALQDEAHDLTEELEIIVETLPPNHPHVEELADQLGNLVKEWQGVSDKLSELGARIAGFNPGHLEWYGVVDGHLILFSWCQGEDDIEWWHPLDSCLSGRRPLVEA